MLAIHSRLAWIKGNGSQHILSVSEQAALDKSDRNYERLAATGANVRELSIAESAEMQHRLNCFAEGIGVLIGG